MCCKRIYYRFGYILGLKNRRGYFVTLAEDNLGTSLVPDNICNKVDTDNPNYGAGFLKALC